MNTYLPENQQDIDDIETIDIDKNWHKSSIRCPKCNSKNTYIREMFTDNDELISYYICDDCNYENSSK